MIIFFMFFFFFFQAEDGIRDVAVTGVQTCALPISAEDAVRYARLAREAGFNEFIKLEVIGDQETLLPDVQGLLVAARTLVAEGFKVLAYTNEDLVTALRLEDAGCAAVMPLASPIGSGLGLLNPFGVRTIKRRLKVPVVVDAGVGTASDACLTME